MPNPHIEIVNSSVDSLFNTAESTSALPDVYRGPATNGNSLEGVFVPYNFAVQGFTEMGNYRKNYLGVRSIKNVDLVVVRRFIDLALDGRYNEDPEDDAPQGMYRNVEQFIPGDDKLYSRTGGGPMDIPVLLKDIDRPLETIRGLTVVSENRLEIIARKLSTVATAAQQAA